MDEVSESREHLVAFDDPVVWRQLSQLGVASAIQIGAGLVIVACSIVLLTSSSFGVFAADIASLVCGITVIIIGALGLITKRIPRPELLRALYLLSILSIGIALLEISYDIFEFTQVMYIGAIWEYDAMLLLALVAGFFLFTASVLMLTSANYIAVEQQRRRRRDLQDERMRNRNAVALNRHNSESAT